MLLVYRLFEAYPPEKLLVLETTPSQPELRLPGVHYSRIFVALFRLTRTRMHKVAAPCIYLLSSMLAFILARRLHRLSLEGIVTVSHGQSWMLAAGVAKRLRLPLFILSHDDWRDSAFAPRLLCGWLERRFGNVYRSASLRFCISPCMEKHYRKLYGVSADLLYPGRSVRRRATTAQATQSRRQHFRIAYAGSLSREGYMAILQAVAECLHDSGGILVVYSPMRQPTSGALTADNIEWRGHVPNDEIIDHLRNSCDALVLPMSSEMGTNASISFPSKLVDYTETGLPILVVGPPHCSAVRWARANDVGIVAEQGDRETLRKAICLLAEDAALRQAIGQKLKAVGDLCFSHERTAGLFHSRLRAMTG